MGFVGTFDGTDAATGTKLRIRLNADSGDVTIGGNGRGGDVLVADHANVTKIRLEAGGIEAGGIAAPGPTPVGPGGTPASTPTETILLSGDGIIGAGGNGTSGRLILKDNTNEQVVTLNARPGVAAVGGKTVDGQVVVNSRQGERIILDSATSNAWLGGHGQDGDLLLLPAGVQGDIRQQDAAHIWLNGATGNILLRGVQGDRPAARLHMDASTATTWVGGNGQRGDLYLLPADVSGDIRQQDKATVHLNGDNGNVVLFRNNGGRLEESIRLDPVKGDVILSNADCAEEFDVAKLTDADPGTVLVIDDDETLAISTTGYDRRVAGVVSGAGAYRPGIVLDRRENRADRPAVALLGKVFCKVDAAFGPIQVGDLLVTSPTPGHAMTAADPTRTPGAVLGKALRAWGAGCGLIPILVSLQ
jgi:hypothetical protein